MQEVLPHTTTTKQQTNKHHSIPPVMTPPPYTGTHMHARTRTGVWTCTQHTGDTAVSVSLQIVSPIQHTQIPLLPAFQKPWFFQIWVQFFTPKKPKVESGVLKDRLSFQSPVLCLLATEHGKLLTDLHLHNSQGGNWSLPCPLSSRFSESRPGL